MGSGKYLLRHCPLASLARRNDDAGRRTATKEAGFHDRRGGGRVVVDVGSVHVRLVEVGLRGRAEDALCGTTTDVVGGEALHCGRMSFLTVSAGHVETCDESVDVYLVALVVFVVVVTGNYCCAHHRQLLEGAGARTVLTATPDVVGPPGVSDHNLEGIARLAAVDGGRSTARTAGRPTARPCCWISSWLGKCSGTAVAANCDLARDVVGSAFGVVGIIVAVVGVGDGGILSNERADAGIANRTDTGAPGRCRLLEKIKRGSATGLLPKRSGRLRGGHSSGHHVIVHGWSACNCRHGFGSCLLSRFVPGWTGGLASGFRAK